ncbi:hypothetical protein JX265_009537 [Neoarthrinium moseri]|uniref:Clr5 domain-containing protein n=1 Tax=Neoarthrinium moseri TaxID=1658444 RepID=A0A9Q0AL72_9PEZI|nr:hypothetical protein JX265_009537 [Neoarthrinium moseri]
MDLNNAEVVQLDQPLPFRTARSGPSTVEWQEYKDRIAFLYLEEDRPLNEVMEIMLTNHGFKASVRMYKFRFQQWGFRKYLSKEESKRFVAEAVTRKDADLPVVHGRELGSKRLKARRTRLHRQSSRVMATESRGENTLLPMKIDPPDVFRLADNSLRAVIALSKEQLKLWGLTLHDDKRTDTANWASKTYLAAYRIYKRQEVASNFQVLNKACDEYKDVVRKQEPHLIYATYTAVLQLLRAGNELAMSFLRLAMGLCSIYFGRSHPLTLLWANLLRLDPNELRQLAIPLMDAQFELFLREMPEGNTFLPLYSIDVTKLLGDLNVISNEAALSRYDSTIESLRHQIRSGLNAKMAEARLIPTLIFTTLTCLDTQEYGRAEAALAEAEELIDARGEVTLQKVNLLETKAELLYETGNYGASELHYKKALETAQKLFGTSEAGRIRIGHSFTALENFYIQRGDMEGAELVRSGYDEHLKHIVGEAI